MSLPTCQVTVSIVDAASQPVQGALVVAQLSAAEEDGGLVVPGRITATTNASGTAILPLWPNARGNLGTHYRLRATKDGALVLPSCRIYVPNVASGNAHDMLLSDAAAPIPVVGPVRSVAGLVGDISKADLDGAGLYTLSQYQFGAVSRRLATDVYVTDAPFNADSTGGTDASAAIQAAIDSLPNTGGTVVVADGLYMACNIKLDGTNGTKSNVTLRIINAEIRKPAHADLTTDADRKANVIQATHGHGHRVLGHGRAVVSGNRDRGGIKPPYCTKHQLGDKFSTAGRVICTSIGGTSSSGGANDRVFVVTAAGAGKTSSTTNISVDLGLGYVTEVTSQPFNESTGAGYLNSYQLDDDFAFRAGVYFNGLTQAMQNPECIGLEVTQTIYGGILRGNGPLFASLLGFGTYNARVELCYVHDCSATCIGGGGAVASVVTRNRIGWTTSSGIRCDDGCHHSIISLNQIDTDNVPEANACVSIYKSDHVTVMGNQCTRGTIGLSSASSDGGIYVGNKWWGCGYGMSVSNMDGGTIADNDCYDNLHWGIKISGGGSGLAITGNNARTNTDGGIWLDGVVGATYGENTAQDNGGTYGHLIDGGAYLALGVLYATDNGQGGGVDTAGVAFINGAHDLVGGVIFATDTRSGAAKTQQWGIYSDGTLTSSRFGLCGLKSNGTGPRNLNGATGNLFVGQDTSALLEYSGEPLMGCSSTGRTAYMGGTAAAGGEVLRVESDSGRIAFGTMVNGSDGNTYRATELLDGTIVYERVLTALP